MASAKDVVKEQLQMSQFLIGKLTEDLADSEYFRPMCKGGNHTGWCLGHIAVTNDKQLSQLTGKPKEFSDRLRELFQGGSKCVADEATYPSRKEIDAMYSGTHARALKAVAAFDESRWEEPNPEESMRQFFPTLGALWSVMATHPFWHIGQITACRSALQKKPAFFG